MLIKIVLAVVSLSSPLLFSMEKEKDSSVNELSHSVSALQVSTQQHAKPSSEQKSLDSVLQLSKHFSLLQDTTNQTMPETLLYLHLLPKEILALLLLYSSFTFTNEYLPVDDVTSPSLRSHSQALALQVRKNFDTTLQALKHYLSFDSNYTKSLTIYKEVITKFVDAFSLQQRNFIKQLLTSHALGKLHLELVLQNQKNNLLSTIDQKLEQYCKENKIDILTLPSTTYEHIRTELRTRDKEFNKLCTELEAFALNIIEVNKEYTNHNDSVVDAATLEIYNIHSSELTYLNTNQIHKNKEIPSYKKDILNDFYVHIASQLYIAAYLGTPQTLLLVEAYLKQQSDKALNTDSTALGAHKDAKTFSEFVRTSLATDCLCIAAQTNNIPLAQLAYKYGADVRGRLNLPAFNQASLGLRNYKAMYKNKECQISFKHPFLEIEELIPFACPLLYASIYGYSDIVTFLIEKNAHLEEEGKTVTDITISLFYAIQAGHYAIAKLLLNHITHIPEKFIQIIMETAQEMFEEDDAQAILALIRTKRKQLK